MIWVGLKKLARTPKLPQVTPSEDCIAVEFLHIGYVDNRKQMH